MDGGAGEGGGDNEWLLLQLFYHKEQVDMWMVAFSADSTNPE